MCSAGVHKFSTAAGKSPAGNTSKRTFLVKMNGIRQRVDRPSSAVATQLWIIIMLCSVSIAYCNIIILYSNDAMLSHFYIDSVTLRLLW